MSGPMSLIVFGGIMCFFAGALAMFLKLRNLNSPQRLRAANRLIDDMLAAHSRFYDEWHDGGAELTAEQQRNECVRDNARTQLLLMVLGRA